MSEQAGPALSVFVAGGGGAVGRRLIPMLVARGHQVTAMTRKAAKAAGVRALGALPVIADALDREAVHRVIIEIRPDVVIHQLTSLAAMGSLRAFDDMFAETNRLRTTGTRHLLEAARAAGTTRFVAQSFAGWPYARTGGPVKSEDDPLDPAPPRAMSHTLAAIRALEAMVLAPVDIEGIVLRYGSFYGPGTGLGEGGDMVELVRRRKLPIVGDGAGVWSFVHIDDVATATVLAAERGRRGIYNIVDDQPAAVAEWLPALAHAVGAPPPRRVPVWLGRLFVGAPGVSLMTRIRGASNARARRTLGWAPEHPSWRQGFEDALGDAPPRAQGRGFTGRSREAEV
jgi:2-alkyl-3-oxoalkanoate reductase